VAKIKPARKKPKSVPALTQGGVSCLILIVSGMALVLFFLYFALKYANG
jgi:hypothetical protein